MASKRPTKATQPAARPRFAVYLRISRDPDGTSDAPDRQLADCRAFAKLRGWDIAEVFEDRDLSAYRKGVVRPAYEQVLDGLAAGRFDGVLVWRLDRLVRRTMEFARFWSICDQAGAQLASVTQPIDTGDPVGMLVVNILVAFAEMESATTSVRSKAKERAMALEGRHKHAGRRAYGMRPGWTEVEPGEAAVIREVADRLLAGESARSIVADLNARGVPSASGGQWRVRTLTSLMCQARLFAKREHHGEIVADGDWPAILDEDTGMRLRALLDRPGPAGEQQGRKYLLTGLLRCQKCGTRMTGTTTKRYGLKYICPPANGGCGGTSAQMGPVDEVISDAVLYRLDSPELSAMLRARREGPRGDDSVVLSELGELSRRRTELAEMWAAGDLDRASWLAAQRTIEARTEELSTALADIQQAAPLRLVADDPNGIGSAWAAMSVDRRRAVIDAVLDRVVVHGAGSAWYAERLREGLLEEAAEAEAAGDLAKAKRRRAQAESRTAGGGSFRPERLELVWRV